MNLIKQTNLNLLRSTLRDVKTATKPQLAALTGLTAPTINTLVKTLLDRGEIQEEEAVQPTVGRPAAAYSFNAGSRLALVVYTHEKNGLDTAFYSVCNLHGETVGLLEKTLENIDLYSFDDDIGSLLKQYPAIGVVGLGLPATESNGRIVSSDYERLLGTDLCSHIREVHGVPAFIATDIKAAAAGYCHSRQINEEQCVVVLYFPNKYPPGAGIMLGGKLMEGRDGLAGRVKHLPAGIDWNHFDCEQEQINDAIATIAKIMICAYNPHKVVIYSENAPGELREKITEQMNSRIEKLMVPEITILKDISPDYGLGITCLALDRIL